MLFFRALENKVKAFNYLPLKFSKMYGTLIVTELEGVVYSLIYACVFVVLCS